MILPVEILSPQFTVVVSAALALGLMRFVVAVASKMEEPLVSQHTRLRHHVSVSALECVAALLSVDPPTGLGNPTFIDKLVKALSECGIRAKLRRYGNVMDEPRGLWILYSLMLALHVLLSNVCVPIAGVLIFLPFIQTAIPARAGHMVNDSSLLAVGAVIVLTVAGFMLASAEKRKRAARA